MALDGRKHGFKERLIMISSNVFRQLGIPNKTFAMRTREFRLPDTFVRANAALKGTRSSMFVGSSFVPSTSLLTISRELSKVFRSTFIFSGLTFCRLTEFTSSLSTSWRTFNSSTKKAALAIKLKLLIKTKRVINTFADHKLFSIKGIFTGFKFVQDSSSKRVCALGLNTLKDTFGTGEVLNPKVVGC